MHPDLAGQLKPLGGLIIDFIDQGADRRGFTISTKMKPQGIDCSRGCGESDCQEESLKE